MMINDREEIKSALSRFRNLFECVIESIAFSNFTTTVLVRFHNVWDEKGSKLPDLTENPHYVTLAFHSVERFALENSLTPALIEQPNLRTWGLMEVASVMVDEAYEPEERLRGFHRMVFRWGGIDTHRIEVVFQALEVSVSVSSDWKR
jgi:hypothetical protein